jgi:hypothetical protein
MFICAVSVSNPASVASKTVLAVKMADSFRCRGRSSRKIIDVVADLVARRLRRLLVECDVGASGGEPDSRW